MNRLIIVGSPRENGRASALAEQLFEACIEDCPNDELALAPVSTLEISGCINCGACEEPPYFQSTSSKADTDARASKTGSVQNTRKSESTQNARNTDPSASEEQFCSRCAIDDDMAELYPLIDAADELIVVSPVFFASAPAHLKALLDRLQPYYWTDARKQTKRPAVLHVVGEGGDPHGYEPLVGTVASALSVAGFQLETVYDWVGKITEAGEITEDASVRSLLGDMHD